MQMISMNINEYHFSSIFFAIRILKWNTTIFCTYLPMQSNRVTFFLHWCYYNRFSRTRLLWLTLYIYFSFSPAPSNIGCEKSWRNKKKNAEHLLSAKDTSSEQLLQFLVSILRASLNSKSPIIWNSFNLPTNPGWTQFRPSE